MELIFSLRVTKPAALGYCAVFGAETSLKATTSSHNMSASGASNGKLAAYDAKAPNGTVSVHTIKVSDEGKLVDKKLDQHTM